MAIIKSVLDSDLYKISMNQAVIQCYPNAWARYDLINRGPKDFPKGIGARVRDEINQMAELKMTDDEESWLRKTCPYLSSFFISYLKNFRYDPREVVYAETDGDLYLRIEGPWYRTILWEVQIMAIISEIYHDMLGHERFGNEDSDLNKFEFFRDCSIKFADFGTRRRRSFDNQNRIVEMLKNEKNFNGTSNMYLAYKYNLKPIGTQAHEWFMFHGSMFGYRMANRIAMERWVDVYQGSLGIALSDTFTSDAFLKDFSTKYAKLFDGVRQDSGDPIEFAKKVIAHYKKLNIEPLDKTIVFSDSLNCKLVDEIEEYCCDKINTSYGIGTNLTCDIPGVRPLNIVLKMTACAETSNDDYRPTVKLSDSPTKYTGDKEEIEICKQSLGIK
jgi:nicotinate phosphoribosyltransferase